MEFGDLGYEEEARQAEVTDERVRGKGCRVWRRMEMDGGDVISAASTQINYKSITCDGLKSYVKPKLPGWTDLMRLVAKLGAWGPLFRLPGVSP